MKLFIEKLCEEYAVQGRVFTLDFDKDGCRTAILLTKKIKNCKYLPAEASSNCETNHVCVIPFGNTSAQKGRHQSDRVIKHL